MRQMPAEHHGSLSGSTTGIRWRTVNGATSSPLPTHSNSVRRYRGRMAAPDVPRKTKYVDQKSNQKVIQFLFGTELALRQCLPGENAEKAFGHVHPRSVGGIVKCT